MIDEDDSEEVTPKKKKGRARPEIVPDVDERKTIDAAIAALVSDPEIYQMNRGLVRVVREKDGMATIIKIDAPYLSERLSDAATWIAMAESAKGKARHVAIHPPKWCVQAILSRQEYPGIRYLDGVTPLPPMRQDGSICIAPGFDPKTETYFSPRKGDIFLPIPDRPTEGDILRAVETLRDPLVDFPFDEESDRAAIIATILTVIGRDAIDGPVPMTLVRAPVRGSGKGMLCQIVSIATTGREVGATPSKGENVAEWSKLLLGQAMSGARLILLDNLEGRFGNSAIASALTERSINDRVLGVNDNVSIPWRAVILANGNNVQLKSDMDRRTIVASIDPQCEFPEHRQNWKHPTVIPWAKKVWTKLLAAAYTILRGFINAGSPGSGKPQLGSYYEWDSLIRCACIWAGIGDPDGGRQRTREGMDDDRESIREFLHAWRRVIEDRELTTAQILLESKTDAGLGNAIAGLVDLAGAKNPSQKLGLAIKAIAGRVVDGLSISPAGTTGGSARWALKTATAGRVKTCQISGQGELRGHNARYNLRRREGTGGHGGHQTAFSHCWGGRR